MENKTLISEYYRDDKGVAKVYKNTKEDGSNYLSILFKDADGERLSEDDFEFNSLREVEDLAEDWALGVGVGVG
jgi:hypothetical protein